MQTDLCDVLLIAGFLGAGKTTLLTHILNWPGNLAGTAILVNEFGKIGIDGELLEGLGAHVVEMANGCICCSLLPDFRRSVEDILERFHPQRLIVEATGVADPRDIIALINEPRFRQKLRLSKTVTVVDADFWDGRDHFGPLFLKQIEAADLIVLNKIDLQPAEMVTKFIAEIQQACPASSIMPAYRCCIYPDALWELQEESRHRIESPFPMYVDEHQEGPHEIHHGESNALELGYINFSFETSSRFSEDCFRSFMKSVPVNLYRVKGFIFVGDRWIFVNHVGGRTEWSDSGEKESSRLAFVGWQVDKDHMLDRLRACLMD